MKIILKSQVIGAAIGIAAVGLVCADAHASILPYTGTTYTQGFSSLPYTYGTSVNTADPVTIGAGTGGTGQPSTATVFTFNGSANASFDFANPIDSSGTTAGSSGGLGLSSTMSGWYGGAATLIKVGASAGDQTTGGVVSFGALTSGARNLGLLATSTTGITTFGVQIQNNTATTYKGFTIQFQEDLWRQQTVQQPILMSYLVTSPGGTLPLSGATQFDSFSFATGTSTGSTAQSSPILTAQYNAAGNVVAVNSVWAPGSELWLTWQTSQSAGGSQGVAISNFSFNGTTVPEPASLSLLSIGGLGLLARRRPQSMARARLIK